MLDFCLEYYSLHPHSSISLSLYKLIHIQKKHHINSSLKYKFSYEQTNHLLDNSYHKFSDDFIQEIFRYASIFRIITNLTISPYFIEWEFNSNYERDLFFVKFQIETRQYFIYPLSNY